MRYIDKTDIVFLDDEPVIGVFAVDDKAGIVRRYVLDKKGRKVYEGQRAVVETLHGEVKVELISKEKPEKNEVPKQTGRSKVAGEEHDAKGSNSSTARGSGPPGGSKGRGSGTARENAG